MSQEYNQETQDALAFFHIPDVPATYGNLVHAMVLRIMLNDESDNPTVQAYKDKVCI